jgi:hypothetical protein
MSFKLKVDKSGWNKLRKDLMKIDESEIQVGWFEQNRYGPDNSNLPMAYVAALNEMGHVNGADAMIPGAITPPRPFMRVGFRQAMTTTAAKAEFKKMIQKIISGQSSLVALKQSANFFENLLQKVMRDWDTPPNASLTIEMKGFNDPLRNTGELIDNVTAKVSKRGG